ncbi:MAG: short-chain dehydrogenase [Cardiobacteriales bacterium]|nr:MAG: short-chain dehydrogenase [Cardiobacteriales bacterium]
MTKTILLTGATLDLGSKIAHHLDQQDYTLLLIDHEQMLLESLGQQLKGDHTLVPFNTWTADASQYATLTEMIGQDYEALDGIIFAEMYGDNLRPMIYCNPETWLKALQINLTASLWFVQVLLPNLIASQFSRLIFTTHDKHRQQPAYWHGFGVSQQALHALIQSLYDEKAAYQALHLIIVDTGWIDTSVNRNIFPDGQAHWLPVEKIMPLYDQALAYKGTELGHFAYE